MEFFITALTAVANILLGLFTYLKNPKSDTHRSFAFLTFIISAWAVTNFFSLHSPNPERTLFWIRAVMFITAPLGPTIFLLVKSFPDKSNKMPRNILLGMWAVTFLTAVLAFTPFIFTDVKIQNGNILPQPGVAFPLYALIFLGGVISAFVMLIGKYLAARGLRRTQLRYLLFGIVVTFSLLILTNFLFVFILHSSAFVIFGPAFSLILVGFISIAIIRHRFLDIKLILLRALLYALSLITLVMVYTAALFIIARFVFGRTIELELLAVSAVLTVTIALTFRPLKQLFEKITENFFYRPTYDPQAFLQELSEVMTSTLVLNDLSDSVLQKLQTALKITSLSIIVKDKRKTSFIKNVGWPIGVRTKLDKVFSSLKPAFKKSREHIIVFDELPESKLKEKLRTTGISVALPLLVDQEIIGGVFLGERASGESYNIEDINLLKIFAPQFTIAIQNAVSYEEIRNFNVTLEQEVDRATHKLRLANQRLQQLDKLKDEFVSVASHELRTPMTAIKSYIWLALKHSSPTVKTRVSSYLTTAYSSTERLIRLVQDMLTISRIEGNHFELKKSTFAMSEIIKPTYDELQINAIEKKISFTLKRPPRKVFINADKEKVREVFQNIIGNAIKFTPEKGDVTVEWSEKDKFAVCRISDTGPGIAEKNIPQLFEKFSRLEDSYVHLPQTGTGLGLYIAKQIVDLHHGRIEITSNLGKGTTFSVALPLQDTKKIHYVRKKGSV